ncbi:DNA polymerase III subunit gamma and tau [Promicromonospora sp. NPDC060271]|uniref:DNA polymerase III subunit gamma and tau n=1 Tax=Promicromonospora sp. NPDC060271 TaxID=3347089 RepID=UPI003662DFDA
MSTALYRRYRPETFAEVIGQDHVTGPLMQALRSGRVNHAYLFSGPRGCGKTTSARILARTLNCAKNTPESPIDTPCGECPSCVELARGGSGSLDVVEIDAASHNGVDDARDLRERATFAPARDRYKIFILDEAHMVTPQGFNALLKIVEEPPPHIKFIFATTEPDKVIGTIRSRTHHYPFRLVPPDVLSPYLEQLCAAEGVEVTSGVLPLVTRAGGGSVRDSLSVMDQLIAGAPDSVVDYDLAVGLLGFTHATLLDDVVDALAARDGGSIFRVVDQIIVTGHEPRRFVEDVLERLRDLIVIGVSGDAASAVLRGIPTDQLDRMRTQAGRLGVAELSRAADLVNAALTEMTGATSPRLHLELLCARLLLPGADDGAAGFAARIDRLERGGIVASGASAAPGPGHGTASGGGTAPVGAPPQEPTAGGLAGAAAARAVLDARKKRGEPGRSATTEPARPAPEAAPVAPAAAPEPEPTAADAPAPAAPAEPEPAVPAAAPVQEAPVQQPPAEPAAVSAPAESQAEPAVTTETVRRRWPEVLGSLAAARVTWSLVGPNAQVASLEGNTLKLGFAAPGLARTFSNARHTSAVEEAVYQTLGIRVRVEATLDEGPSGGGAGSGGGTFGGGPSTGASPSGGPAAGGVGPVSDEPGSGAPAPDTAPAPDWPDVPPPGGASATVSATSASAEAVAVVGATAVGAVGGGPSGGSVATAQGSVAVAERPEPSRPRPTGPEAGRPEPSRPAARPRAAASAADEAWLSGASATEPPADYDMPEPEPVYEDQVPAAAPAQAPAPARAPMSGAGSAREALRQANERRARAASGAASDPRRGTTADVGTSAPRTAVAPAGEPDLYDEPSADDPDITSAGMVGVPLVVQVLGGTVIEEIVEQS